MNPALTFRKTRIAPTPSGFLHLGNILSFALTAAIARKTQARILLRIDDLDRDRATREYVEDIFSTLRFLNIPWDEGPRDYLGFETAYSQLHRMNLYREALEHLRESKQVFACNCSRTRIAALSPDGTYPGTCRYKGIPLDEENVSWRLCTTGEEQVQVKTLSGQRIKTVLPPSMSSFVVRKKDGFPAYQLTSIIDDQYFGIDLVVRGEDLWPSTLAQLYLSSLLPGNNFQHSTFWHHPLLMGPGDRKLSKSAGDTSIQYLRKQGKTPADIFAGIAAMAGYQTPVTNFEELLQAATIF
ncbi:glutamate--tRNA ligase family protein [uncultured Chitinophaga sp.]|jgi:Glutamyl- and glutaminyl-tRNA synthetases|uniref:glutamate--tRNA ligase family protein n=1 Tax=uncultured Chitinophaga sp. TaxID=339340 RepID=UPI002623FEAB|nr:glutamate--tRNA ligase family protein [uncultured Chitinophaga sp.]